MQLDQEIKKEYDRLVNAAASIPTSSRHVKIIEGTGGKVSLTDLIAYQIGWGKCLIRWYESGIKEESPEMPGEGFLKWDYVAIAEHFYTKYRYDQIEQEKVFQQVVSQIICIVENEYQNENLERLGVWQWCTLSSGKQWPLAKWIKVNTCSPYKRAYYAIRKAFSRID